jgi:hypothetical protein
MNKNTNNTISHNQQRHALTLTRSAIKCSQLECNVLFWKWYKISDECWMKSKCYNFFLYTDKCKLHKTCYINPRNNNVLEKKINTESLKKAQHGKIENVAGSVWLCLFMDGTGKCKLPSTPPSTGLSRIQHLNVK